MKDDQDDLFDDLTSSSTSYNLPIAFSTSSAMGERVARCTS